VLWVCCALLLLSGSIASAQSSKDLVYGRSGIAVGFHGLAAISPSGNRLGLDPDLSLSNSGGFGFSVEYRFNKLFSVGLMAETVNREISNAIDPPEEFRLWTMSVDGRFHLAPGRMQPYMLFGVGFGSGEETNLIPRSGSTAAMIRVGGGAAFYFTEHFVLDFGIGAPILFGDLEQLGYLSITLGLRYRF
jgi:opacity protein-like surface antigen